MTLLPSLLVAASSLTASVFLVLWLLERRSHRQLRLNFQKRMGASNKDRATVQRLSQTLNFRDGGVGSAMASFRRSMDSINDWVPELMSDPDMANDVARVNQFLTRLLDDELVNLSHSRLADATRRTRVTTQSSKGT